MIEVIGAVASMEQATIPNVLPVRIFVVTISILAADKPLKISKYYLVARQLDNTIESQQHLS